MASEIEDAVASVFDGIEDALANRPDHQVLTVGELRKVMNDAAEKAKHYGSNAAYSNYMGQDM